MMSKLRCALSGLADAIRRERSMRIHLAVTFYVALAGLVTRVTRVEWAVLTLCVAGVISLEAVNTALERLCDRVSPGRDALIGKVKDLAAGAVLCAAVASVIVGGLIFFTGERVARAMDFARTHIAAAALIIASVPFAAFFAFRRYTNEYDNKNSDDNGGGPPERR
jgi:diacylglycerol kinase